jgi:hypothetical protein
MKRILLLISLLSICMAASGQAASFHRPALSDDPMRHLNLIESLGDGYIRIPGGVLDPTGKILGAPGSRNIKPYGPYFLVIGDQGDNLMRRDGTLVFDRFYKAIGPFKNGFGIVDDLLNDGPYEHHAMFDMQGKILGGRWFHDLRPMQDGMAYVEYETGEGTIGANFIRPDGTLASAVPLDFDEISDFSDGFALVRQNGQVFFVDKHFQSASPPAYIDARSFSEGFAAVLMKDIPGKKTSTDCRKDCWRIIDTRFKLVGDLTFKRVEPYREGFALVTNSDNLFNLFDSKGKLLLPRWHEFASAFQEGFAIIGDGGRYTFIDRQGEYVSERRYDQAWPFEDGYAMVKKDNKYNFIDRQGKIASKSWFDEITRADSQLRPFHPYKYAVLKDGLSNFLDKDRQVAFKYWFDGIAQPLRLLVVSLSYYKDYMILDLHGNPILPDIYNRVGWKASYGYLHVERKDGKQNLFDAYSPEKGFVSDEWFDLIDEFNHGRQCIYVLRNGLQNLMFIDGSFFIDPWSEEIQVFDPMHDDTQPTLNGKKIRYAVKVEDGYMLVDDTCQALMDQRFSRVETAWSEPLCVEKGGNWYRINDAGALEPVVFSQCSP